MSGELRQRLVVLEKEAEATQERCRQASVQRRDVMREMEAEKQSALKRDKDRRAVLARLLNEINSTDAAYRAKLVEIEQVKQEIRTTASAEAVQ